MNNRRSTDHSLLAGISPPAPCAFVESLVFLIPLAVVAGLLLLARLAGVVS